MVRKQSKGGLNTGNTLRCHSVVSRMHKRGYLVVEKSNKNALHTQDPLESEMNSYFPYKHTDINVEYSLDKKGRWTVPDIITTSLEKDAEDDDLELTVMEHPLRLDKTMDYDRVKYYHSNSNGYHSKVCKMNGHTMQLSSAKHKRKESDHLSKKERRQLRKLNDVTEPANTEDQATRERPAITCHVAKTPELSSNLFHTLNFNFMNYEGTASAKRRTRLGRQLRAELQEVNDWCEDEESIEEATFVPELRPSSEITVDLDEILKHGNQKRRTRRSRNSSSGSLSSTLSGSSSTSCQSNSSKDKVVYVDTPPVSHYPVIDAASGTHQQASLLSLDSLTWDMNYLNVRFTETNPEHLIEVFGDDYMESFCAPRVFSIKLKNSPDTVYLIFMEKPLEKHMFRIYLVGDRDPASLYSFLVDSVDTAELYSPQNLASFLTAKLRSQSEISYSTTTNPIRTNKSSSLLPKWDVTATSIDQLTPSVIRKYTEEQTQNLMNQKKTEEDFVIIPRYCQRSVSCLTNCGICFETADETATHSALLPCQHYFCADCWCGYLITNIKQGSVHLKCPHFECEKSVDPVFVRAFVNYETYKLYESMLTEHLVLRTGQGCWCPKERCEQLLVTKHSSKLELEPVEAQCMCGTHCCMRCQQEPHWPLSCKDYQLYKQHLLKAGVFVIKVAIESTVTVHSKPCPTCNYPIEKDGGCVHMTCIKCRTSFCWKCCRPYIGTQYYHECEVKEAKLSEHTFTHSLVDGGNTYLTSACRHRVQRADMNFGKFKRKVLSLVPTFSRKRCAKFMNESSCTSLKDLFNQIVKLVKDCHRLLEFSYALNGYSKQTKIAASAVSQLEFLLWNLETNLNECADLHKVYQIYKQVNSHAQTVVQSISKSLNYC